MISSKSLLSYAFASKKILITTPSDRPNNWRMFRTRPSVLSPLPLPIDIGDHLIDRRAVRFDIQHLGLAGGLLQQRGDFSLGGVEGVFVPPGLASHQRGTAQCWRCAV